MQLKPYAENINLSKYPKDYVVVDLETTGLSPSSNEIIEIGALKVVDLEVVESFSTLVNPGVKIPHKVTDITGITNESVKYAPKIEDAIAQFKEFAGSMPLVGHNIDNFDIKFLKYAGGRIGEPFNQDTFDTNTLAKKLVYGSYKLISLAEAFGINVEVSHRALDDCKTTHELYLSLIDLAVENSAHPETIEKWVQSNSETGVLSGLNIVFTGSCDEYSRKELTVLVIKNGGTVQNNVTLKTNILVCCDENISSKVKKAQEYEDRTGIETILLDEFLYLVENDSCKPSEDRPQNKHFNQNGNSQIRTKQKVQTHKSPVLRNDLFNYSDLYQSSEQQAGQIIVGSPNLASYDQEPQKDTTALYSRAYIKPVRSRFKIILAIITTVIIAIFFIFNLLMFIYALYAAATNMDNDGVNYFIVSIIVALCDVFCGFIMYKLIRFVRDK